MNEAATLEETVANEATEPMAVVVTTKHRGVFFGYLKSRSGSELVLTQGRVCVHWSAETKGFVGLASTGPLDGSRISPAAPEIELFDITSILHCSPEAAKQWESGKWR